MSRASNDRTGYQDITPAKGILQGSKFPFSCVLKDSSGTGVTGQAANLTLEVIEPSGTTSVTAITDNGSGVYEVTNQYTLDESGEIFANWIFDDSTRKLILGQKIKVSPKN